MKKRSIGLMLAAIALVTLAPGATQAAHDSCPAGGWVVVSSSFLDGVDRVGDRPLDPGAEYCATINPGQTTLDPLQEVWIVGPEMILEGD